MWSELKAALAGEIDPELDERLERVATNLNEVGFDKYGYSPAAVRKSMALYG